MKTRWGTCNIAARGIWLNLELIKKPAQCLEYIIVHELAHFFERNHSDRFVALHGPDASAMAYAARTTERRAAFSRRLGILNTERCFCGDIGNEILSWYLKIEQGEKPDSRPVARIVLASEFK